MPQFRKKPVVVEAIQWIGYVTHDLESFLGGEVTIKTSGDPQLVIDTPGGVVLAQVNDWIVRKGDLCPCKPDIFAATYDAVDDSTHRSIDELVAAVDAGEIVVPFNPYGMTHRLVR